MQEWIDILVIFIAIIMHLDYIVRLLVFDDPFLR